MKIIYLTESGIAIISPTGKLPIEEVARKDVPAGVPYLFVEDDDIPMNVPLSALTADFSQPDGYGIGPEAWFAERRNNNV